MTGHEFKSGIANLDFLRGKDYKYKIGDIAQLAEQPLHKRKVDGSSPSIATKN